MNKTFNKVAQVIFSSQTPKIFDEKVAKMNQLLTTGQEELQQEKKTVEMLRQKIVSQTQTKVGF